MHNWPRMAVFFKGFNMLWFVVIASVVVGGLRFFVPSHDLSWPGSYEAIAHIFVGFLIAMMIPPETTAEYKERIPALIACFVAITAVELFCFLGGVGK